MNLDSVWAIPLRTLAIYIAVLVGLRLSGKRQFGQMTPFDFVLLLLIANGAQNAMVGNDTSLLGGVLSVGTLIVANFAVGYGRRKVPALRRVLVGEPTELVTDGRLIQQNLDREEITEDELLTALREHGIEDIADVERATLEVDGAISVLSQGRTHRQSHRHVRFLQQKQ